LMVDGVWLAKQGRGKNLHSFNLACSAKQTSSSFLFPLQHRWRSYIESRPCSRLLSTPSAICIVVFMHLDDSFTE
jgi:hypothetical protein